MASRLSSLEDEASDTLQVGRQLDVDNRDIDRNILDKLVYQERADQAKIRVGRNKD